METPEERDQRLKAQALLTKIEPLLGKFYASPDLCVDLVESSLSAINISKLNTAFNKLNEGGELDDKEKQLITGVVKAVILFALRDVQTFMGDEQFKAVVHIVVQKFVDTYSGSNFQVPEEIKIPTLAEIKEADAKKREEEEKAKAKKESGIGEGEDEPEEDSEEEATDASSEDESGEEDSESMESESSAKAKEIRYMNSTSLIIMDLIKFMKKIRWQDICLRLVKIKETPSFESKSSEEMLQRLTFRVPPNMKMLAKDLIYKYEIVIGGKPIGLIHSTQHSGNSDNKRIWRVSIRNHFQDASYRSGYSNDEPFTVVKGDNIVLHNMHLMTMKEARAWVRTVVEK